METTGTSDPNAVAKSDVPDGTPLPTTDTAAQIGEQTVEEVIKIGETVAESAIEAAQPWLAWPVIKQLWEGLFEYIANQLGKALGILTGYMIVNVQKYVALKSAAQALADLNAAKKSGDKNEIDKASKAADDAVAPILHYIGDSRHP